MVLTPEQSKAQAFAELVRKQSGRIASLIGSGKHDQAAEMALSLCDAAADRKMEIERPKVEEMDLATLRRDYDGQSPADSA